MQYKNKKTIEEEYKQTFRHSQFIEHTKILDFITQIEENNLNAIKEMIQNYFDNYIVNQEFTPKTILADLDNLNYE